MKLKKITVEKFKRVSNVEIELSSLNILVGANGSGKSSILQAVHLASCLMRQAPALRNDNTSTVSVSELDYLPSDNYSELGHNQAWGNQWNTPSSKVEFDFFDDELNQNINAWCEIRSARNAGISVKGEAPMKSMRLFRGTSQGSLNFFSAYIPGISGIPNEEEKRSKRVVLKACSFGDSNVYLRNALNLLKDEEIKQIQDWLRPLVGEIEIIITHKENKDLNINARAKLNHKEHPLELLGAGFLQLIQIFCYVLLFKPKILLIDEPDIHLHPNVQEKLALTLNNIAKESDITVLMTTHSPFVVRGAPLNANIYWMEKGRLKESKREAIELAMGWGAFGKKIIIVSEDSNNQLLRKIISQWPDIESKITFLPGRGYKNLLTKEQAIELYKSLGEKFHLLVHRDRDSLTDDEVISLKSSYEADGVSLWLTDFSDIEAYFCTPNTLSEILECDLAEAERTVNDLIQQHHQTFKDQFSGQRGSHNQELYQASGGSPDTEAIWSEFQSRPLKGAKGKTLFKKLKNLISQNAFSEQIVLDCEFSTEVATSLKTEINAILGQ